MELMMPQPFREAQVYLRPGSVENAGQKVALITGSSSGFARLTMEALTEVSRYELRRSGVDFVILEPGAYNTDLVDPNGVTSYQRYLRRLSPKDARRRVAYGDLAQRAEEHLVEEDDLPGNQEIADAIASLVRMPSAERPVRMLGPGVDYLTELTELHANLQRDFLLDGGYGD